MKDSITHNDLNKLMLKGNQRLNLQHDLLVKMSAVLAIINGGAAIAIIGYFEQLTEVKVYMLIALGMYTLGVIMTLSCSFPKSSRYRQVK